MERKSLFTYFVECFTQNYFNFSGRARRREFWGFSLFTFILWFVLTLVFFTTAGTMFLGGLGSAGASQDFLTSTFLVLGVWGIVLLVFLIPSLAVQVRRLHDRGMSGWWIFFSNVLGVIFNVLQTAMSITGADSTILMLVGVVALAVLVLNIYLLVQFVMDGEVGANKYGEDPKASERLGAYQG
ncbi:MAG: DUF805 domain-containing protein [Porphyromonas sp.]|nr:DUF805 domain-containing protein [Porphyromonas sp.]